MRQTNFALALLAAAALTACGGSNSNSSSTPPAKPVFAAQISFGDSLSDVGTYAVGTVAALGGGKYTINGNNIAINPALHGKNWTELMAAQLGLPAPCAAVTGLDGDPTKGFSVPVVDHPTCFGFGEGGSRVTNPVGPGNKLTGSPLGQLTYPVVQQVATELGRNGGAFKSTDIVYVWAGGNDLLMNLAQLTAAATAAGQAAGATAGAQAYIGSLSTRLAAGATDPVAAKTAILNAMVAEAGRTGSTPTTITQVGIGTAAIQPGNSAVASPAVYGPMTVAAQADATAAGTAAGTAAANAYASANGPALVPIMAQAGAELAALIKDKMVAKGATHIVLNSLPDVANSTPTGIAQSAAGKQLIDGMVSGFNIALRAGIDGLDDKVLWVDLYTASHDQVVNPSKYGISNATKVACGANALGTTSLVCNASNTLKDGSGNPIDVSHYLFADDVHPAPYGQTLIANAVANAMKAKGWL